MSAEPIPQLDAEFAEQCRRQLDRPLAARIRYGFNRVHKPVLDDAPWRSFATMAEYRAWCAENLPEYLGFKPAAKRRTDVGNRPES